MGLLLAIAIPLPPVATPANAGDAPKTNPSGLTLPRYVSLKSSKVNARRGPGYEYPIAWTYERAGLPVEVIKEYDTWRQIRDSEGAEAWVLQALLSGRRTALILPWETVKSPLDAVRPTEPVRVAASANARVSVRAEAGTLASIASCDKTWCQITISDPQSGEHSGYVEQRHLWGVYVDEAVR